MQYLNKTADLIYQRMLHQTTSKQISQASLAIMNTIQSDKVQNQLLGLAAALICMLHMYDLSHTDVLGIADNIVYSGQNGNMLKDFKAIQSFMKNEWEI